MQASGSAGSGKMRNRRPRKPQLAVDQHVNFSEKFMNEVLQGNLQQEADVNEEPSAEPLPVGTKRMGRAFKCVVCDIMCYSRKDFDCHIGGKRHRHRCLIYKLKQNRESLMSSSYVTISSEHDDDDGYMRFEIDQNVLATVEIKIKNICKEDIVEFKRCEFLRYQRPYSLEDRDNVTRGKGTVMLAPGDSYAVRVRVKSKFLGRYNTPIAFLFTKESGSERIHVVRNLSARCSNSIIRDLKPTAPYRRPPRVTLSRDPVSKIEEGYRLPPMATELEKVHQLPSSIIPENLRRLINKGLKDHPEMKDEEKQFREYLQGPLNETTHNPKFKTLLHTEEIQMEVDIKKYDMQNVTMDKCKENRRLLVLRVPGLVENRPSVLRGDCLYARFLKPDGKAEEVEYKGYVHEVRQNEVCLGFSDKLVSKYTKGQKFNVRFTFNRLPLKLQHRAVQLAEENSLGKLLFPSPATICKMGTIIPTDARLHLYDKKLESNPEQLGAVKNILAGHSRPAPYVVFGPPGTGKTVTIVEAIKQIWKNIPSAHVLACAPSNSAADLLTERLISHIPKNEIYRMNAASRTYSTIPAKIMEVCNWNKYSNFFEFPKKEKLLPYKVIVCTLVTSGRLATANFPPGHFTHVFIDESGHAVEPEAVIAVAGILECDIVSKDGAQVVLAGDPKQLGPILRSPVAIKCGLDISLLERLMDISVYQKNQEEGGPLFGKYNDRLVTKLVKNYRSHPALLKLPNEMFYDNDLEAHAERLMREYLCRWEELPKKDFPLIFHGVMGEDQREERSPSFFNPEEVAIVLQYVEKLLETRGIKINQQDIGIISPYRKQVQKIQQVMRKKNWNKIQVGSTEEFQGQEKSIIIISTVRSNPDYLSIDVKYKLGFLKNPKRFNVAVTRAKALLIVVGNPYYLAMDKQWSRLLDYCIQNGAYMDNDCEYTASTDDQKIEDIIQRFGKFHLDDLELDVSATESYQQPQWRGEN